MKPVAGVQERWARVVLSGVSSPGTPLNVAYPEYERNSLPSVAVASRQLPATRHGSKPGYTEESESGVGWEGGCDRFAKQLAKKCAHASNDPPDRGT